MSSADQESWSHRKAAMSSLCGLVTHFVLFTILVHGCLFPITIIAEPISVIAESNLTQACSCSGPYVAGQCYSDLDLAVQYASPTETIWIPNKVEVIVRRGPITVEKTLKIQGHMCQNSTQRPTISALFPAGPNEHGIFAVTAAEYGPQQLNITIENLVFKRHPLGGPAAFLRSGNPNRDGGPPAPRLSMNISNVTFSNFETYARGGSVIFVRNPGDVRIDRNTKFLNNTIARHGERYGGGGSVWLYMLPRGAAVEINATFENNIGLFEHSLGGGLMVSYVRGGNLTVRGRYVNNTASDGGAIHITEAGPGGIVLIDGLFLNNTAREYGWGSRAGAIRLQYIATNVTLRGYYHRNRAPEGRGGVVAINSIRTGGILTLAGNFSGNVAGSTGAVLDQISGGEQYTYTFEPGASLVLDPAAVFIGNRALGQPRTNILNIAPLGVTLSETEWAQRSNRTAPLMYQP